MKKFIKVMLCSMGVLIALVVVFWGCISYEEQNIKAVVSLDEKRVIPGHSFDIELEEWGNVRFISYLPSDDVYMEDVSFLLVQNSKIVYEFPTYYENNSTENASVGIFDSVAAVGFQDVNLDGLQDVIIIINYVTGAGPQGMLPRPTVRIFLAEDNGFMLAEDVMNEIMRNMDDADLSISNICKCIESSIEK